MALEKARKDLRDQHQAASLSIRKGNGDGDNEIGAPERPTAPFLAWTWLNIEPCENVSLRRRAAENLFAIMKDVERSLAQRNELCYKYAMESTLENLEACMTEIQSQSSNAASEAPTQISPTTPTRPGPHVLPNQSSSVFRFSIRDFLAEDAVLLTQQSAIYTAINDLFASTKRFVGLYIPCTYPHSVCNKIWGSLSRLTRSATLTFGDEEQAKQTYIIRPLEAGFLEQHSIKPPLLAFQDCTACREGHLYKSPADAVSHLKAVHFHYETSLTQLAHLQTTYRYFVRTETDVRNELANKQQLGLLRICLNYLKTLVARAEKIHAGVNNERPAGVKYQLPDDLVDCFEATALFLMQTATSVVAIEEEMRRWQHVPGKAIEELNTATVQYALEKLAELGQLAQASMTKAEKTLALAGAVETNIVNMGPAGPELLLSILLQTLQRKPLLGGVDMDVNQLYQEYTSKLQYQINQFPRKRLLRDIHALQEELSVVHLVNGWQQKSFESLLNVFDPQSFEVPTSDRINMFPPESECINEGLKVLQAKATELMALQNRTHYLREQLKQSVEILEEDHGKAILVFTMITTIFLPLSFVTSFFGMNMVDIRDTNRTQGFFWAIAVPVTAGIVFVAVMLAYHGDKLYDAVVLAVHQVREHRARKGAIPMLLEPETKWRTFLPSMPFPWTLRKRRYP
ncbi:hypothetical protein BDW02DRAFT_503407 [Decorospora gaudefroyi]|uniref:DUF7896 domain-containing protein n=1 Tax=Decorospora gaudefroyi TaxID=184978 RepID=A0A6A5K880_9PLEO|nr:hypothetical protein BDW02DRAFT_503407 [Decorospora gaudefroyi]